MLQMLKKENEKLHIICSNCGSNEHLSYFVHLNRNNINPEKKDYFPPHAVIKCNKCDMWYNLDKTIKREE